MKRGLSYLMMGLICLLGMAECEVSSLGNPNSNDNLDMMPQQYKVEGVQ
jgi:hypothetical protein